MARNRRVQPGLNEAPDLLVLIERARMSAALPGSELPGEGPLGLGPFGLDPPPGLSPSDPSASGLARSAPAASGPAPPDPILSGTDGHRSRMRARLLAAG